MYFPHTGQQRIKQIARSSFDEVAAFVRSHELPPEWVFVNSEASVSMRHHRRLLPCVKVDNTLAVTVDTGKGWKVKTDKHTPGSRDELGSILASVLAGFGGSHASGVQ